MKMSLLVTLDLQQNIKLDRMISASYLVISASCPSFLFCLKASRIAEGTSHDFL